MKFAQNLVERARKADTDLPRTVDIEDLTPSKLVELRGSIVTTARAVLDDLQNATNEHEARKTDKQHEELMRAFDVVDTEMKFRRSEAEESRADREAREARRPGRAVSVPAGDFSGYRQNTGEAFTVRVNGQEVPAIRSTERLTDKLPYETSSEPFSLGDFVRGNMGLQRESRDTVVSATALVPTMLSNQIIDAIRAKATIVQAGASTITVEGPTNIARITGDPTIHQHSEGANDITESNPTFDAVTLNPKALVALIPLSAEVVADSPNLDAALGTILAAAFAQKLDSLSLATILADGNIATSATAEDPAAWAGVLGAVGSMLAADMDVPSAAIFNSADWMALVGEQASTAGTWLGAPPELSQMRQLQTTKVDSGTAVLGDFARAFAIAVRQNLRLEMVRFSKSTEYSHTLVAHARMDGYVVQPGALYIAQESPAT